VKTAAIRKAKPETSPSVNPGAEGDHVGVDGPVGRHVDEHTGRHDPG
jgi:hypothetical protein